MHYSNNSFRDFIEKELVNYAKDNPGTVVYLKPRRHRTPVIVAEYRRYLTLYTILPLNSNFIVNGDKQYIHCPNFTSEEVSKWLNLLRTQAGNSENYRLRKLWHTDHPSIQGPWTPYTFKDPAQNLVSFPNAELGNVLHQPQTATQKLLDIFKDQQKNIKDLESNRGE